MTLLIVLVIYLVPIITSLFLEWEERPGDPTRKEKVIIVLLWPVALLGTTYLLIADWWSRRASR